MTSFFQRLLYGRNGMDQLSLFLIGLSLLLSLLGRLPGLRLLWWGGRVLLLLAVLRVLSKDLGRRRGENARFLSRADPWIAWGRRQLTQLQDREHRYFLCPKCGQTLRVPRGKGKVTIRCRQCAHQFTRRS